MFGLCVYVYISIIARYSMDQHMIIRETEGGLGDCEILLRRLPPCDLFCPVVQYSPFVELILSVPRVALTLLG